MCGIFGIAGSGEAAPQIVLGLYGLQHRGPQGVGVTVSDGTKLKCHREADLVTEVFHDKYREELFKKLGGMPGIGHVLYSTVGKKAGGKKQPKNLQPLIGDFHGEPFAVAHNGNLIDFGELRKEAESKGYVFKSGSSDTEVILALVSTSEERDFISALKNVLPRLKGAFSLVFLLKDKVIGVRDKFGIRPLCLGRGEKSFMLASENCAFYELEAELIRDIEPGEIIILGENGIEDSFIWADSPHLKFCVFEYVYFARQDSILNKRYVYSYREEAGRILAEEQPVDADIVVSVPESGRIYGNSFSEAMKIPLKEAIFGSRYHFTRTFLASRETNRRKLQKKKQRPLRIVVHGKRVCACDDSIVRASASPEIAAMLRKEGATEVHLRVGSSPIRCRCFLGIDIPSEIELAAAHPMTVEDVRSIIQADTLGYLSIEGMIKASGLSRENLCLGCFIGEYPDFSSRKKNLAEVRPPRN